MRSRYLLAALIVAGVAALSFRPSMAEEAPSKETIARLIEQMGSIKFEEREQATKSLAALGVPALQALRQASKSYDAEVRKRAEEIIPNIESQAESQRVLAAMRLHLSYKDTPLHEAVADLRKKSAYPILLHDPDNNLRQRKITLDTGETTFWHALRLFCEKAQLTEEGLEDLNTASAASSFAPADVPAGAFVPAGQPAVWTVPVRHSRVGMNGQLVLKDGKKDQRPSDDHCAVRIRALLKSYPRGKAVRSEIFVPLEASPEPRLQWQALQSILIEKAIDDQDQKLTQVIPQVEGVAGFGGVKAVAAFPAGGMGMQRVYMGDGLHQSVPVYLKKEAKTSQSLKELKGVVTAQLLTDARPMITADKLDKATGQVFKGECGGSIKIVEINEEQRRTTLRLEFEQPPSDKVVPAQPVWIQGVNFRPAVRIRGGAQLVPAMPPGGLAAQPPNPAVPQPAPLAPAGVQFQMVGGRGGLGGGFAGAINGLSVQDEKGHALPIQIQQTQFRFAAQGNGGRMPTLLYTLVCSHDKDKGQPAKVVYLGRKRVTVEIPFDLKDVPLP